MNARGTSEGDVAASAPGKLVLSGEYAVLHGAPAIVAAVQVRARVQLTSIKAGRDGVEARPLPPEVLATRRIVEAELGAVDANLVVDVSSLRAGDHKLGVGSSAAAAVACAGALARAQGADVEAIRDRIFAWALAGHAEVAPRGSGVDVAASTHGGVIRCVREDGSLHVTPSRWPNELHARVVFTGSSARTSDLLASVDALGARDATRHDALMSTLRGGAIRFAEAFDAADVRGVLDATVAYHDAMRELGEAASAPIVEERLARIAALAATHDGAAKPSGAGGGDVAIAFFASESARARFDAACADERFVLVDVPLGGLGVTADAPR